MKRFLIIVVTIGMFGLCRHGPAAAEKTAPAGGLAGYWRLGEDQGLVAMDRSGRANHGTLTGGVTRTSGEIPALAFDGRDGCVDCGADDSLSLHGKAFSLVAWIDIDQAPGTILSKELGGKHWPEYVLTVLPDRRVRASFWTANTPLGVMTVTSRNALSPGRWYHVAAAYDGSVFTLYVDGVKDGENGEVFGSPYAGNSRLFIGAAHHTGGAAGHFNGRIADVAVFSRCLSASQVAVCHAEGVAALAASDSPEAQQERILTRTAMTEAMPRPSVDPSQNKRLFLDDHHIESMQGLTRVLHRPVKHPGNPVLRREHRWEDAGLQSRTPPQWIPEEGVWKLWYLASETRWGDAPDVCHMCLATSADGIVWEKPLLHVFNYHGSVANNVFLTSLFENIVYAPHLTGTPYHYRGLAGALGRWPVASKDGVSWKATGAARIESGDESFMTYDETTGLYLATVKVNGPYGRAVALSTSSDFWNWSEPELNFHADEHDQVLGKERIEAALADPNRLVPSTAPVPEKFRTDVYNMPVFPYEGLYVGLPCMFDQTGPLPTGNQNGFLYVELVSSRDLKTWHRVADRAVFIGSGPKGTYDCGMIISVGRPVVRYDELWFYYNGFTITHGPCDPVAAPQGICLATLRLDGFVSLDAGEREGELRTRPMPVSARHLFVNVDAPAGALRAEVLTTEGVPVPGFSLDRCVPVVGDRLKLEVKWEGQDDLSALMGADVQVRFTLSQADFYAFWFAERVE